MTAAENAPLNIDTSNIREWRSIVTLIVFVLTNLVVLFPFHIPIYIPRPVSNVFLDTLGAIRIIPPRHDKQVSRNHGLRFVKVRLPMDFITAPIIADLFLLAILAIGREEVKGGTVGAQNIAPYDIMVFFLTLAYIAISVDASGLIRYLAFKVLQWGGAVGHRLFFYLYAFFFVVGGFIGNDPIILSGTAFLAYMTRVSSNIVHPRAWIHTQFAVANIASAILVSSNPTNLVLAGAFQIRFFKYTINMIVPVVVTAIVLFPFLLYVVFNNESLIPTRIEMHQLSEEAKARPPVNPNIPNARGDAAELEEQAASNTEEGKLLSLEEILNPFLDKRGAGFGGLVMAATLVTVLVLNAVSTAGEERPVYWVTLPASAVMFAWDVGSGWLDREKTREIARKGRKEVQEARDRREAESRTQHVPVESPAHDAQAPDMTSSSDIKLQNLDPAHKPSPPMLVVSGPQDGRTHPREEDPGTHGELASADAVPEDAPSPTHSKQHATLVSLSTDAYRWCQETFPTATAVLTHLPFALVPFAFAMFVLVQALVTKGWVPVFAWGWEHWVRKTGVVGAVGGMGFLSVILCNASPLAPPPSPVL
jgi:Na+/H+ antiporter NhaD/arsenite permease-like protein